MKKKNSKWSINEHAKFVSMMDKMGLLNDGNHGEAINNDQLKLAIRKWKPEVSDGSIVMAAAMFRHLHRNEAFSFDPINGLNVGDTRLEGYIWWVRQKAKKLKATYKNLPNTYKYQ